MAEADGGSNTGEKMGVNGHGQLDVGALLAALMEAREEAPKAREEMQEALEQFNHSWQTLREETSWYKDG
ncbi:hypothetical protein E2C01_039108 [Portunus trituberculatus]|uniref:Uncharacterized protein n=1 Tax=Portunus trituberculatus TaxID=210409 RepID=A0A5B7FCR5_PORTR|nr:hypothetical protein [Portunus trituberculatus]